MASTRRLSPHLEVFHRQSGPDNFIPSLRETFEIEDFTSASEWEKFVHDLEEILRKWNKSETPNQNQKKQGDVGGYSWKRDTEMASYHGFIFSVERFRKVYAEVKDDDDSKAKRKMSNKRTFSEEEERENLPLALKEMMSAKEDFPHGSHPINYFYGFQDFIVLIPQSMELVDNQTRVKVALSSVTVAAHNTECAIPIFLQIMDRSRAQFSGILASSGYRTNFEMAVLRRIPPNADHLSGLMQIFKSKLSVPRPFFSSDSADQDQCSFRVTIRKTFHLPDFSENFAYKNSPPDMDLFAAMGTKMGDLNDVTSLPVGSLSDPVGKLVLHTTWSDLQEDIVTENEVHSDLEPTEAPQWTVSVDFQENPPCLLSEYLENFLNMSRRHETSKQILGADFSRELEMDENIDKVPDALKKLTGGSSSSYGLSDLLDRREDKSSPRKKNGPIPEEFLYKILEYLFPDSKTDSEFSYSTNLGEGLSSSDESDLRVSLAGIKSCPVDGLLWRLTVISCHCLYILGGIKAVAHLLHEFMLEIRFRFDSGIKLPGIPNGAPDTSYCLLHQKLQLLNVCIEKKIMREKPDEMKEEISEPDESEEEFFDCEDEQDSPGKNPSGFPRKPEGRKKKFGQTKLLEKSDTPLFIPVCQDPVPMTEDQLAEQAEIMIQMGDNPEGSELRTRMQSASLLSDMESFKAANPGCVLGDFVRWHSPRDWLDEEGRLSPRMEVPGNAWLESWENAKPVPARRQRRLFNDTLEAEKVIQYLVGLRPGQFAEILTPTFFHAAVLKLSREPLTSIPGAKKSLEEMIGPIATLSRTVCKPEVAHYSSNLENFRVDFDRRATSIIAAMSRMKRLEISISRALSLRMKFVLGAQQIREEEMDDSDEMRGDSSDDEENMNQLVAELSSKPTVKLVGGSRGPAGRLLTKMFEENSSDPFSKPISKEYVIRAMSVRPHSYSKPSPQRLYACVKRNEFRLAGAFTLDKFLS